MDDDSEWSQHKKLIDTKDKKGQIWKCLPSDGTFNYVHVDFNGTGGFAHIIEDATKYTKTRALEVLGGAIGHILVNLNVPLRRDKALKYTREIKKQFRQYDWTKHQSWFCFNSN